MRRACLLRVVAECPNVLMYVRVVPGGLTLLNLAPIMRIISHIRK
jgi:hypothetical protein